MVRQGWGGGWWSMMEGLTPCTGLPRGVIHLHLHPRWNHAVVSLLQNTFNLRTTSLLVNSVEIMQQSFLQYARPVHKVNESDIIVHGSEEILWQCNCTIVLHPLQLQHRSFIAKGWKIGEVSSLLEIKTHHRVP